MPTKHRLVARAFQATSGLCTLFAVAVPANAHIVFSQPDAAAGSTFAAGFRVGHGCDGKPTTRLRIEIPETVSNARPQPKAGWAIDIERAPLAQPVTIEGKTVANRVAAISWSGRLEADQFDTFAILMKLPTSAGPLYFPTTQTCDGDEVRWTDIPTPGQSSHDLPHPAPVLTLTTTAADAMREMPGMGPDPAPVEGPVAVQAGALAISGVNVPETPGGNGAVYLIVQNSGGADRLTGAKSDLAGSVELHTMSMDGAVMEMRKVDGLDVPAGGALTFGPGGNHIMLIGLKAPLRAGLAGSVTLVFAHQGEVVIPLIVSPRSAESGHDHH